MNCTMQHKPAWLHKNEHIQPSNAVDLFHISLKKFRWDFICFQLHFQKTGSAKAYPNSAEAKSSSLPGMFRISQVKSVHREHMREAEAGKKDEKQTGCSVDFPKSTPVEAQTNQYGTQGKRNGLSV
jgi:hypothetical protein